MAKPDPKTDAPKVQGDSALTNPQNTARREIYSRSLILGCALLATLIALFLTSRQANPLNSLPTRYAICTSMEKGIWTVDPESPRVDCIAVIDGRVAGLGPQGTTAFFSFCSSVVCAHTEIGKL
jgi:hypothetical protein